MERHADLHIHSDFSDSDQTLWEIFEAARQKHLLCIAITDHDTLHAIPKARTLSARFDIELLDGLELSAQHNGIEAHILGYGIDIQNPVLLKALEETRAMRRGRIRAMIGKLRDTGISIAADEFFCFVNDAIPTRLHLAQFLVQKKITANIWEAFKKYLSYTAPCYVAQFRYSVREAIGIIKSARGVSILAHPHFLPESSWLDDFIAFGLDGIEAIYPRYSRQRIEFFVNFARHHGLLTSGGSDAH